MLEVFSFFTIKSYRDGTNKTYLRKYTTPVVVLKRDIVQGEIITQEMIETINVNNSTVPTGVVTASGIVGLNRKYGK